MVVLKNLIVTGESQDGIDVVIAQKSLVLVQVNCTKVKVVPGVLVSAPLQAMHIFISL